MTQMLQARSSGDVNHYCSSKIWTDSSFYTSYSFSVLLQYVNNLRMLIFFFSFCVLCNAASASSLPQIVLVLFFLLLLLLLHVC